MYIQSIFYPNQHDACPNGCPHEDKFGISSDRFRFIIIFADGVIEEIRDRRMRRNKNGARDASTETSGRNYSC